MKCPNCGGENLHFYAFSICADCGVRCDDCDFEIESEVSWEDCSSEEEHDKKCYKHLVELIENGTKVR